MDMNQRPHSRSKTVGSGSARVSTGRRVNTGSRPVGGGSRPSGGSGSGGNSGGGRSGGGRSGGFMPVRGGGGRKISLKSIIIFLAIILIGSFVLKKLGGGNLITDLEADAPGYSNDIYSDNSAYENYFTGNSAPDLTVSNLAREKYVTPVGGGRDVVTVMVYMCGTDLESKYGMATKDLSEMVNAKLSDNVNLIVQTGGCSGWKNKVVSENSNQIYKIENGGLSLLEKNAGKTSMTDPDNLTDFINYCEKNYPADRNMLIFWDHGGGSVTGFGYDERYGSDSMTLAEINSALKKAGCKFDFIGFDACLMATLENALVCNGYADYLIASEETEPGTGWYYTNWLTELSENTSMPTVKIAQKIIDDFVAACGQGSSSAKVTLSVIDLAELQGTVPDAFNDFATSTTRLITSDDYTRVSDARAGARQFAQSSKINQVDLIDLAKRIGTNEALELAEALKGCVKYNKSTISNSNGISIYFPYETTKNVKSAIASYKELGLDSDYTKCIQSFASLEYGGQIAAASTQQTSSVTGDLLGSLLSGLGGSSSASSTSPIDVLLGSFLGGSGSSSAGLPVSASDIAGLLGAFSGRSMPDGLDWVDTQLIADNADRIAQDRIDPSHITVTEYNGRPVLRMSEDEWKLIQKIELNVFAKDGAGYVDLGLDNTFDILNGDLLVEYDGTWLTVNGNVCAYYLVSDTQLDDGSYVTVGRIPALLNGQTVNLQVVFDDEHPGGTVTGAYPLYDDGETDLLAKGDIEICEGDEIELLCDYYDENGNFESCYTLGTKFTVPAQGLSLVNLNVEADGLTATYRLTDIYDNAYWVSVE